jgi:putative transposase
MTANDNVARMIHHHDNGSQYQALPSRNGSFRPASTPPWDRSAMPGINALAESTIGLFKTEKIDRQAPWKTLSDVACALPAADSPQRSTSNDISTIV